MAELLRVGWQALVVLSAAHLLWRLFRPAPRSMPTSHNSLCVRVPLDMLHEEISSPRTPGSIDLLDKVSAMVKRLGWRGGDVPFLLASPESTATGKAPPE